MRSASTVTASVTQNPGIEAQQTVAKSSAGVSVGGKVIIGTETSNVPNAPCALSQQGTEPSPTSNQKPKQEYYFTGRYNRVSNDMAGVCFDEPEYLPVPDTPHSTSISNQNSKPVKSPTSNQKPEQQYYDTGRFETVAIDTAGVLHTQPLWLPKS